MDEEIKEKDRNGRLTIKAEKLNCSLELANYIDKLEIEAKNNKYECPVSSICKFFDNIYSEG